MKFFGLFTFVTLFICQAEAVDKVIYGADNRMELIEFSSSPLAIQGASVAVLMDKSKLKKKRLRKSFRFNRSVKSLEDTYHLCEGKRFGQQPTAGICTGVLVHPKLILTAGHCYESSVKNNCREAYWVFDYKVSKKRRPMKMKFNPKLVR
jgi:hypothetical protein